MNKLAFLEGYLMKEAAYKAKALGSLVGLNDIVPKGATKRVASKITKGNAAKKALFKNVGGKSKKAAEYKRILKSTMPDIPDAVIDRHIAQMGNLDGSRQAARTQLAELTKNIRNDYRGSVKPTLELSNNKQNRLLNNLKSQQAKDIEGLKTQHAKDLENAIEEGKPSLAYQIGIPAAAAAGGAGLGYVANS